MAPLRNGICQESFWGSITPEDPKGTWNDRFEALIEHATIAVRRHPGLLKPMREGKNNGLCSTYSIGTLEVNMTSIRTDHILIVEDVRVGYCAID